VPDGFATDPLFKRRLKKKPPEMQAAVLACMEALVENPWGNQGGLKTKLLKAANANERVYYARIDRANRITFHMDGDTLVFRNHCHKVDVLRNP
jgi:hypothetical protein